MNPTQKRFSLNRGASRKQIPINIVREPASTSTNCPRRFEGGSKHQHQCSDSPRQVFLFGQCSKQRKPYLMRYRFEEQFGVYLPVASHIMETEGGGGRESFTLPKISSEQLDGCPPCPYCHAPGAGSCGNCGTIFCSDPRGFEDVVCPGCQATLKRRSPNEQQGSFQVRQSLS